MTHAYTKQELINIANVMGDDDVLLGDTWDREHFCEVFEVSLTPELWKEFIGFYSEYYGLELLNDEINLFMERKGLKHEELPPPPADETDC